MSRASSESKGRVSFCNSKDQPTHLTSTSESDSVRRTREASFELSSDFPGEPCARAASFV